MGKRIYVAHTFGRRSLAQGVIGVYPDYELAKADLQFRFGWRDEDTDWGHFIRVGELGKGFDDVLALPKSEEGTMTTDEEWADIVSDIQHIVALAGANPEEADKEELDKLAIKMTAWARRNHDHKH
jgi:hypothetical protein